MRGVKISFLLRVYEAGTVFISSRLGKTPLAQVGSQHNRDNIFHINTSFRYEKRSTLIFHEINRNCKTRSCLFNILSLKKQPTRTAKKKDSPKGSVHKFIATN